MAEVLDVSTTPNPDAMKFTVDRRFDEMFNIASADDAAANPFAKAVFDAGGVATVFGTADFITVTRTDDAKMSVEFSKGTAIAGIQVASIGDGLTHMMISSAHPGVPSSPTTQIVGRVFVICKELNVECTHAQGQQ